MTEITLTKNKIPLVVMQYVELCFVNTSIPILSCYIQNKTQLIHKLEIGIHQYAIIIHRLKTIKTVKLLVAPMITSH